MDTATLVFAGITLWFALRGFWLGLPAVLVRLVALAAGYAAAIFLAPGWVDWVDANTPLDGLTPYPATLLATFFGVAFLANLIGGLIIRLSLPEDRRHGGKLPAVLLNGAFGAAIALVAVWCVGLLQTTIHPDREPAEPSALQAKADTLVAVAMRTLVSKMSPEQPQRAAMTEQLLAQPAQTVSDLRFMANHAALNSLLRDPDNQALMKRADIQSLKNSHTFREFTRDQRAKTILLGSGLLPEGTQAADYDDALAAQLITTWKKIEAVRDQPDFQAIIGDTEFRQQLQEGNLLSLINDERSAQLAEIVWSAQPADTASVNAGTDATPPMEAPSKTTTPVDIHRWQDSEGRWHFSDQPNP
ncbi:MAG TPA: CvpA family protein [Pseudomonadales bacterium]